MTACLRLSIGWTVALLLLVPAPSLCAQQAPPIWRPVLAELPEATVLPKVATDLAGDLWVTYQDSSLSYHQGTVRKLRTPANRRQGFWDLVGPIGGASVANDWWPNLAFAPTGEVFRASYDYRTGTPFFQEALLNVRRFDPVLRAWELLQPFPYSLSEAHFPDIAVDPQGRPVVGYRDGHDQFNQFPFGSQTVLRFERGTHGQWTQTFLGGQGFSRFLYRPNQATDSITWFNSLEVHADGRLWASWKEWALPISPVTIVTTYDEESDAWRIVDLPGLIAHAGTGDNLALDLDGRGTPYLATFLGNRLRVLKLIGDHKTGTWLPVGSDIGLGHGPQMTPNTGYREWLAFAVSPLGVPYVAYRADAFGRRVIVQRYLAGQWSVVGGGPFSHPGGEDDQMSLTFAGGNPVVCFRHSRPTTVQFATQSLQVWKFE